MYVYLGVADWSNHITMQWHKVVELHELIIIFAGCLICMTHAVLPVASVMYYLGRRVALKAVDRTPKAVMSIGSALVQDGLDAGLFVLRGATWTTFNMVGPIVSKGVCMVGKTVARSAIKTLDHVQNKLKTRKFMRDGSLLVKYGLAMSLLGWFKEAEELLNKYPVEAVTILQAAIKYKRFELLDLIISKTKTILMDRRMFHQLACSILLDQDLPSRHLKGILGEHADHSLTPAWWLNEFISTIVTFRNDRFQEYLHLFVKVFCSPHNNAVLDNLKVPTIEEIFPLHVQYQMRLIRDIRLYYIFKHPFEFEVFKLQLAEKSDIRQLLQSIEYYLGVSGLIKERFVSGSRKKLKRVAEWLGQYIKENQVDAELVVRHKLRRTIKLLTIDPKMTQSIPVSKLVKEAISQCSTAIFSIVASQVKRLPKETCSDIRRLYRLHKALIPLRINGKRCAEVISRLTFTNIHGAPVAIGTALAAEMLIEGIYGVDGDNIEQHEGPIDLLINNTMQSYCARRRKWPTNVIRVSDFPQPAKIKDKVNDYSRTTPSLYTTAEKSVMNSQTKDAKRIMKSLTMFIQIDAYSDFFRLLFKSLKKNQLNFSHCEDLAKRIIRLSTGLGRNRKRIFATLMRIMVLRYKKTHGNELRSLLAEINKTPFKKLVRTLN